MNAFSTRSHLAVAQYEAGMPEKEANALAINVWGISEMATRDALRQHAKILRDCNKKNESEILVIDQVLAPAKFPAVSTESGFAQAHHACIERAEKRDETQGVKG